MVCLALTFIWKSPYEVKNIYYKTFGMEDLFEYEKIKA